MKLRLPKHWMKIRQQEETEPGAKDLRVAPADHNYLTELSIWFYVVALLFFTAKADWSIRGWVDLYFGWDKLKDFFWFTLLYFTLSKRKRKQYFSILIYSFFRFAWDVIATLLGIDVNYDCIIDYFFYLIIIFTILLTIKDLRKNVKKNVDSSA